MWREKSSEEEGARVVGGRREEGGGGLFSLQEVIAVSIKVHVNPTMLAVSNKGLAC